MQFKACTWEGCHVGSHMRMPLCSGLRFESFQEIGYRRCSKYLFHQAKLGVGGKGDGIRKFWWGFSVTVDEIEVLFK